MPPNVLTIVDLNSPIRSHMFTPKHQGKTKDINISPILSAQPQRLTFSSESIQDLKEQIDHRLANLDVSTLPRLINTFQQCAKLLMRRHLHVEYQNLTKKYLVLIVKLLQLGHNREAHEGIIDAYNLLSFDKAVGLEDVLLSDVVGSSVSTLKILTLQLIIKTKQYAKYKDSIIVCFKYDSRYLLRESSLKIVAVCKILLNLSSTDGIFSLKFLQYLNQFNLKFDSFIKNMTLEAFQRHVESKLDVCDVDLPRFYHDYSKHDTGMTKVLLKMPPQKAVDDKCKTESDVSSMLHILMRNSIMTKQQSSYLDEVTLLLSRAEQNDKTFENLTLLRDLLLSVSTKRLANVVSVALTMYKKTNDSKFLELAIDTDILYYNMEKDPKTFTRLAKMVDPATVNRVVNFFFLPSDVLEMIEIVETYYSRIKTHIKTCLRDSSEVIEVIVGCASNVEQTVPRMLNSILTNSFDMDIHYNKRLTSLDSLSDFVDLIKPVYFLDLEMKKHGNLNLKKICSLYINNWASKKNKILSFELKFVKTLFAYLKFNKFYPECLELCQHLHDRLPDLCDYTVFECLLGMKVPCETHLSKMERFVTDDRFKLLLVSHTESLEDFNSISYRTAKNMDDYMFNIRMNTQASLLHMQQYNFTESLVEIKKALKVTQTLLKKEVTQVQRLELLTNLITVFKTIVKLYMYCGLSKDVGYYIDEFLLILSDIKELSLVLDAYHFIIGYFEIVGDMDKYKHLLFKSNDIYKLIEPSEELRLSHAYLNKQELPECDNGHALEWKVKMGDVIQDSNDIWLQSMNELNKCCKIFMEIQDQMERDAFFSNMKDSVMCIPSCSLVQSVPRNKGPLSRGGQQCLKQKFDRFRAQKSLEDIISMVVELNLQKMKNYEVYEVCQMFELATSVLFNIIVEDPSVCLQKSFQLNEVPRFMPFQYDKLLSKVGNDIYLDLKPVPVQRGSLEQVDSQLLQKLHGFDIICIDIVGGDLLVSDGGSRSIRLPLNRHQSRDVDEEMLTYDEVLSELTTIITESDMTTKAIVKTKEDRRSWWAQRHALDQRLQSLLESIEKRWFGGFKGLLSPQKVDLGLFSIFKTEFKRILQTMLPSRLQTRHEHIDLDDFVLELFLQIDPKQVDLVEDLIYFVFDILLFHGEENAYDEIDIDLMYVEIETAISEYHLRNKPEAYCHTFLLLGKSCHMIPWESLPSLRGISVSRVPSLQVLQNLLDHHPLMTHSVDKLGLVLNPNNDLPRTEAKFKDIYNDNHHNIVIGQKPDEETFLKMLDGELFIYIGHGGGEHYVRARNIKTRRAIAPSFLLGCSSAALQTAGKLEPNGTVYSYLIGGCPMVVGNLWDVTDKDIDKFSMSVLEKCGLIPGIDGSSDICEAVRDSRDECTLKYLNGAAPVVYGLPLKFIKQFC